MHDPRCVGYISAAWSHETSHMCSGGRDSYNLFQLSSTLCCQQDDNAFAPCGVSMHVNRPAIAPPDCPSHRNAVPVLIMRPVFVGAAPAQNAQPVGANYQPKLWDVAQVSDRQPRYA